MKVLFYRDKQKLKIIDKEKDQKKTFYCDSIVRNEINEERALHDKREVIYTFPLNRYDKSLPYMPRRFPPGNWKITGYEYTDQKYLEPLKIFTDATQIVPIWELDQNGGYKCAAGNVQFDFGYWFHYWEGRTTTGCGRFDVISEIENFMEIIKPYLDVFKTVPLEVI